MKSGKLHPVAIDRDQVPTSNLGEQGKLHGGGSFMGTPKVRLPHTLYTVHVFVKHTHTNLVTKVILYVMLPETRDSAHSSNNGEFCLSSP